MFQENDYVIYQKEVCKIKGIKHIEETGNDYYSLLPIDDESLTIDVPIDNRMGALRNVVSKREAEEIIHKIPNIEPLKNITNKNMESTYKDLMNRGTHDDLIKIIKTSYLRNEERRCANKRTSEKDTKYFHLAEKYLYNELSVALNKSFSETKEYIIQSMIG